MSLNGESPRQKKIIIVDDHPVVLAAIASILASALPDIATQGVGSAAELRTLLDAERSAQSPTNFLMAFVDLNLPDANGVDLIHEIRTQYGLPVIALSGDADPERIRLCVESGAVGFIEKTSKMGIFPAAVNLILSGGKFFPPEYINRENSASVGDPVTSSLTARQKEVLDLLINGKPNKIIAATLGLSEGTVKNHVGVLLDIFKVNSRSQLILATTKIGYRAKQRSESERNFSS
jgi:DNA-binding NarL/FixJ family response regulator